MQRGRRTSFPSRLKDRRGLVKHDGAVFNWPWLGPFVGFRTSTDFGKTWTETPHTPEKPIFGENGLEGQAVKIGSSHFVDFGRNMQHSPDGNAYLMAHGAIDPDPKPRYGNASWISGDQVFLLRVEPSLSAINDPSAYEFFAGHGRRNKPVWTRDFDKIQPLIEKEVPTVAVLRRLNPPSRLQRWF